MKRRAKVLLYILLIIIFVTGGFIGGYYVKSILATRAKPEKGLITVSSRPDGADIIFKGEPLDKKTDTELKDISPGEYVIRLEKKGYHEWEAKINVSPGEEVKIKAYLTKKAEEAEGAEKEEVKDTVAPSTPAQISPSDNVQVAGDTATLTWSEVSDPSGVTYSVEIQYRAGGGVGFVEKEVVTGLTSPQYTYTMSGMMERWRVWAVDGAGNSSPKSDWWRLIKKAD
jgi:hypothetical protein